MFINDKRRYRINNVFPATRGYRARRHSCPLTTVWQTQWISGACEGRLLSLGRGGLPVFTQQSSRQGWAPVMMIELIKWPLNADSNRG